MILRDFKLSDAERVAHLVGDKAVSDWTANIPYPYTVDDAINWINRTRSTTDRHPFAVEINEEIVACVAFWSYSTDATEIGYWVGKEKGIATQALSRLIASDAFPKSIHIVAKIITGNIRSERVLVKCGFKFKNECVLHKHGGEIAGRFYTRLRQQA